MIIRSKIRLIFGGPLIRHVYANYFRHLDNNIQDILHNMQVGKFGIICVEFLFHTKKHFNS